MSADPLEHAVLSVVENWKAIGPGVQSSSSPTTVIAAEGGMGSVSPAVPPPLNGPYTGPTQASGLPILNSNPDAAVAIYVDFDGNGSIQSYSEDADLTTFNASEQANLYECWRHIVLYYSMFNVNVTTVNPTVPKVWSIVGNNTGGSTGGYAYVNTFPNSSPNAFNVSSNARTRQSGIAHEIGHVLGLWHISDYDTLANKTAEYSSGFDGVHGPLMGVDYAQNVHKWFIGHGSQSPSTLQDDVAKIINQIKRFDTVTDGFHPDDYGGTIATATPMDVSGAAQVATGVIERMSDVDAFSFTAPGGKMDIALTNPYPSGLDAKLEVYDASGTLLASADGNSTTSNAQLLQPDLPAGTYYLLVSSHGSYGDLGVYNVSVHAEPTGWGSADIGTVQVAGYSEYDSSTGTYTVAGSGADVYGTADGAHLTYQKITGNATIIARVTQVQNTNTWAKVGVDIRESLAAGAKHADMVVSYSSGVQFAYRTSTGGSTTSVNTSAAAFTPIWLKLVRSGGTITGYRSTDGTTWTQQGSVSISMTDPVYVGLITTSHSSNAINVGQMTDVSIAGTPAAGPTYNSLPAPTGLAASLGTGTGVSLSWNAVAGATGYALERSTDNVNFALVANLASGVTTYSDGGLWGSMRYYYRVASRDATGNSVPSDSVSVINRPNAVTNAAVTSWTATQVILNWRDVSGETGYRVERSPDNSAWTTLTTVGANVPSYTDTLAGPSTVAYYRITPTSSLGDGPSVTFQGSTRLPVVPNERFTSVGSTSMSLAWDDISGESNYKVQWSGNGSSYSNLVTNLAANTTSYTSTGLTALTENYYRVIGTNSLTESVWPTAIFAASPATSPLPAPWSSQDIGAVNGSGATGYSAGTFTVISSGNDIWGSADAFRYTYQPLVGDGEIVARVAGIENTGGWSKIGVMIRDSLAAGSKHVMVVDTPSNGIAMQYRLSTGGGSTNIAGTAASAPYWVRLVRSGSTFTGYSSADGTTWTQVGSVGITMGTSVYIGLSADANTTTSLNTSTIDNVTVSNSAPTIATAASANPSPVTAKTTAISVLGADDHGESNLIYTWAATSVPAGAAGPVFSDNGTNTAKSATATFSKAGLYTLTVTITDTGGLTVTSSVDVQVNQTLASIAVTPAAPTIAWGQSQQFTAAGSDQFGDPMSPQPAFSWAVTGSGNTVAGGLVWARAQAGSYTVTASSGGVSGSASFAVKSVIAGRRIFYNNSAWDSNDPAANAADDAAIATDKSALVPGAMTTFANYTSYSRGINGIMIDVGGLPNAGGLSAADFVFKVGNTTDPTTWSLGPLPSGMLVRSGAGVGGSDRIELVWADNAIQKQWLQITVLADGNTGLASTDVFYFGNAIGDTGNSATNAQVNSADELLARVNGTGLGIAGITNPYDFNRDKRVNTQDQLIARANRTGLGGDLKFITAPAAGSVVASASSGSQTGAAAVAVWLDSTAVAPMFSWVPVVLPARSADIVQLRQSSGIVQLLRS